MGPFLSPALPDQPSLADEIEQDLRRRQSIDREEASRRAGLLPSSVFPPTQPSRSGPVYDVRQGAAGMDRRQGFSDGSRRSGISGSFPFPSTSTNRPLSLRSGSTVLPYEDRPLPGCEPVSPFAANHRATNGYTVAGEASRMMRLQSGSSLPYRTTHPSRLAGASKHSLASETADDFVHARHHGHPHRRLRRPRSIMDNGLAEHSPSPGGLAGRNRGYQPGLESEASSPGVAADAIGEIGFDGPQGSGYAYEAHSGKADQRDSSDLMPEEAWYFMRALVGQEIRQEEALLWKLQDLEGSRTAESVDGVDPAELPILRYLIRHFLLTLPLVRDTASDNDVPAFWTDGLQPIIRALHEADLSKPVDRGHESVAARLYGSSCRNALERFVTAGLKLSSASYGTEDSRTEPSPPTMQAQPSTSLAQRYNFQAVPAQPFPGPQSGSDTQIDLHARPVSSASAAFWSRRFSRSRRFNGPPAQRESSSPPRIPAPNPGSPFVVKSASPSSDTSLNGAEARRMSTGTRRESNGPARPDSAVLPSIPFLSSTEPNAGETPDNPAFPSVASRRASTPPPPEHEVEQLSVRRTQSRTTSAQDTESFVTAGEGRASRASHSIDDEDDNGTTRFETSVPGTAYNTPVPSAALAVSVPFYSGSANDATAAGDSNETVDSSGVVGAVASDGTSTPKENSAFPHDSSNMHEHLPTVGSAAPYTVDEPPVSPRPLAPPIPGVLLPYQAEQVVQTGLLPRASSRIRTAPLRPVKSPERPRTVVQRPPDRASTPPKLNRKFSLASLLKAVRRGSTSGASGPGSSGQGTPRTSHEQSVHPKEDEHFVAHSALPPEFLPSSAQAHPGGEDFDSPGGYEPNSVLPPVLVPKGGTPWPYDAPVPFLQGPDYEQLKWGGFEVDVIGCRKSLFSHSFIIRVRRPGRLDEFVLRNEAHFHRFSRNMMKHFPEAHLRRIPAGVPKNDVIIRPRPSMHVGSSATSIQSGTGTETGKRSQSRLVNGLRAAAGDPHASHSTVAMNRQRTRSSVGSTFTRSLRAQSVNSGNEVKAVRQRRSRAASLSTAYLQRPQSAVGSYRSYPTTFGSRAVVPAEIGKKLPPHDQRRRALRAWLRDVLSVRGVGHHKETATFLLAGSIVPRDADVLDVAKRETIDNARRNVRIDVAYQSIDKVRSTRESFSTIEEEIIQGEGLGEMSEVLKSTRSLDELPLKYRRVLEGFRFDFAATIYDMLIGSESSDTTFSKIKALNSTFPWFVVKQALKLKGANFMARRLQDILIARPLGGKSLLQKILAITFDDDPVRLATEMDSLQARIGSAVMVEKLNLFVHESREKKAIIRRYADENKIELVLCIVRGADEPRLPGFELERITAASKAYRRWIKTDPSSITKAQVRDADVRLVLDLQAYLRLASRERDSTVLRHLLADEEFAHAIEVVAQPFIALLKRTYKVGHGAQALTDLQKFLEQLIIIVEALRNRIQNPQKSIQVIARLLQRHQQNLYTFIRSVHRGETIIEEFLQWAWTASVFLRRGLAQPINLDELIPPEGDEDKAYLLDELEDLVAYHRAKRLDAFRAACRRVAGEVDADDPILVEGDGKGRSQVDPVREPKPRAPRLSEVPLYAAAFKEQLKSVLLCR